MKINKLVIFIFTMSIFFGVTNSTYADVVINEIAWMGTATSVNDEWLELFNNGTTPITLDGWTLQAVDGSPLISLKGTLSAGGYMLLERTDDNSVAGITAGIIYSGALGNEGETLVIKNNTEQIIDAVAMTGGWTAGNASTKETMQKNGSDWITGPATPAALNITSNTNSNSSTGTGTNTGNTGTSGSNGSITNSPVIVKPRDEEKDTTIQIEPDPVYSSRMITPEIFVQQVPLDFSSEVKKDGVYDTARGRFEWSMGDGSSFLFNKSTPFSYTYQETGQYVIMLRYYSNVFKKDPDTIHKKTITVIPATVSITTSSTGTIILSSNSDNDIDLGNWKLKSGINEFTFPLFTILQKSSKINIPQSIHKLNSKNVSLVTPNGYSASQKSISTSYKTSSISNYQESVTDNSESETLFQKSNPENESFSITPKTLNYRTIIWIVLFIVLLIGTTVGMHIFIKKIESDSENEVVQEKR
jgi:hypothetical protein